jgi:2,5-diketo-D-gluconate reductase B
MTHHSDMNAHTSPSQGTPTVIGSGAIIPALGFGTAGLAGDDARRMVGHALELGYRHIDTAQMYENEAEIGEAIQAASVPRDDVFVTTKIWVDHFHEGDLQRSVEESLRKLRTDRIDLLLLHWPNPAVPLSETIEALNTVKAAGLARHIGLSNFTAALMRQAAMLSDEPLAVNQVEYHPFLDQRNLLAEIRTRGMALVAYSPLAQGWVFHDDTLAAMARSYARSAGQVALRWLIQHDGVAAIPSSTEERHAADNLKCLAFALSPADMEKISALARPDGRLVTLSELVPTWDEPSP